MSFLLGLTGSIGMGKSTAASLFADEGAEVWDADAAVRELYQRGNAGAEALQSLVPEVVLENGVDREALSRMISDDISLLNKVEDIVHPLVDAHREVFVHRSKSWLLVFEVPLLFETGGNEKYSAVAVATTSPKLQRERALARQGMTTEKFDLILSRQVADAEKRLMADYLIDSTTMETARSDIRQIVREIRDMTS